MNPDYEKYLNALIDCNIYKGSYFRYVYGKKLNEIKLANEQKKSMQSENDLELLGRKSSEHTHFQPQAQQENFEPSIPAEDASTKNRDLDKLDHVFSESELF